MRQPLMPEWRRVKPLIGMVHLLPLPGSPRWGGSLPEVLDAALADARALAEGGIDGIIVENYGDTPFFPGAVPPVVIAALTAAVLEVRRNVAVPVGVNVLRNDATAALGICAATGASFIRVNVHSGAMLTDQGWIEGAAHETLRLRRTLDLSVAIFADVFVKHASAPPNLTIEDAARDTWERGHADALIVSGTGTGAPTDVNHVQRVKSAVPEAPVIIGSGFSAENAAALLQYADGAIVGTAAKVDSQIQSPVSVDQVRRLVDAVASIHP